MKKLYLAITLFISTVGFAQVNYPGNTKTGFGGPVGTGSLSVSDNGTTLTFVLTKGSGEFNDALVLYIDSKDGGFSTTSGFLDHADGLRSAISGYDGTNRSTLTFPPLFMPDYAVAFGSDYGGVWALQGGSTEHTFISSANLTPLNNNLSPTYTLAVNKADVGLATGLLTFKFLGTYVSRTGYRSDEAVGDLMAGFTSGYNNQTILTFNTYLSPALPVKLIDFKAAKDKSNVVVNWSVAQEDGIESYEIQRSADGVNFSAIQSVNAKNQAGLQPKYTITDARPKAGVNYYRLAINERGHIVEYSKIVTVTVGAGNGSMAVTYVPGGSKLNIKLVGADAGSYSVSVVNAAGQVMQQTSFEHDGAEISKQVNIRGALSKGIYRVVLLNSASRISQAFMVP